MKRSTAFWLALIFPLALAATLIPILAGGRATPVPHLSMRGEVVQLFGHGPYRHMSADVAVQGLAQDWVTLLLALPALLAFAWWARKGGRSAYLGLCGVTAYFAVQYVLYLGMGTYNELFLVWTALALAASQALFRLLLGPPATAFEMEVPAAARAYSGGFLLVNAAMIILLWLGVVLPPLLQGGLYPQGLAHYTTLVVQGYDLALFIPPSIIAGWSYLKGRVPGGLLAPVYSVFLSLQMTALLAKILWMRAVGADAGPALVVIPLLLLGALTSAFLTLKSSTAKTPSAWS